MNDRRDYHSGGGYRNGNGNRGGWGRGGGGGRSRGGRGGYHRGGRDRGGGEYRGEYRGGGGGGGGGGYQGNRFNAPRDNNGDDYDSSTQVLHNLLQMLTQVGSIVPPPSPPLQETGETTMTTDENGEHGEHSRLRMLQSQAKNLQLLTDVICGSNAAIFLQHSPESPVAVDRFGPLVTGLVHCVSQYPLPTPTYTALTLAIHVTSRSKIAVDGDFAARTVAYAVATWTRDMDSLLLLHQQPASPETTEAAEAAAAAAIGIEQRSHTCLRLRLTLRYLVLLSGIGLVQQGENETDDNDSALNKITKAALAGTALSVRALLECLVQAALQAALKEYKSLALFLASLVWSSIPYVRNALSGSEEWIKTHLMEPLESGIQTMYVSEFAPGLGKKAILLKGEQYEDMGENAIEEDEEDEDEGDVEDEESGQVCDSLQDLVRSVHHYMRHPIEDRFNRWALFNDAPWKQLKSNTVAAIPQPQEGDEMTTTTDSTPELPPMEYTGEALGLPIFPSCRSLLALVLGDSQLTTSTDLTTPAAVKFTKVDMTGLVFGRLPIFSSPPDLQADDDEEEEDKENGDAPAAINERLAAYQKTFGVVDRVFIGEAIRDILVSQEPSVSDSGVECGTVKNVAEQIWSLTQAMRDEDVSENRTKRGSGMEFSILETLLSLIAQSSVEQQQSAFSLVYLSRVVLELTRLEPAIITPAIVLAVSSIFTDYLPALVPTARYNLSRWFAFHLIHTDYQWPAGYWKHWEPFVQFGVGNSRGLFVKTCLEAMVENVSAPEQLVVDLLPKDSVLVNYLIENPRSSPTSNILEPFEQDVYSKFAMNETPDAILTFIVGDELAESVTGVLDAAIDVNRSSWWRTGLVMYGLLTPATAEFERLKSDISKKQVAVDDDEMQDNSSGYWEDVVAAISSRLDQYKSVLLGAIQKDTMESIEALQGEIYILEQLENALAYSRAQLLICLQTFVVAKIVSMEGIFKWLLGESSGGSEGNDMKRPIVMRWWEIATMMLRCGVQSMLSAENDYAVTDAMESGDDTPNSLKKAVAVVNFMDPLLSYAVCRVGSLLSSSDSNEIKGSKLTAEQVELVEGLKTVTAVAELVYLSVLRQSSQSSGSELRDTWTESAVAGPRLASLLDFGGSSATDLLRKSLERM